MQWVCTNGLFVPHNQPLFTAANRSFKWGDGVFETARFCHGRLLLADYHFDRLFSGLQVLQMVPHFTPEQLTASIRALCEKNGCTAFARVRIAVYREENNQASYLVEGSALPPEKMQWNEQGWHLVPYPLARKTCDVFSNLKTANYLPYVMAGRYAQENGADEALVLNMHNRFCDGSKTNLFLMNGDVIHTPALSEGPVAGVMRRYVIERLKKMGYSVHQTSITETEVLEANQVFVTNAVEGLRWVQHFGTKNYEYGVLKKIFEQLFPSLQDT